MKQLLKFVGQLPNEIAYIVYQYVPEVCTAIHIKHIVYPKCRYHEWYMTSEYQFIIITQYFPKKHTMDVELYNCHGQKVKVINVSGVECPYSLYVSWRYYSDKSVYITSRPGISNSIVNQNVLLTAEEWKKLEIVPKLYPGPHIISEFEMRCRKNHEIGLHFHHPCHPKGWYAHQIGKTEFYNCGILVTPTIQEFHQMCQRLSEDSKCVVL